MIDDEIAAALALFREGFNCAQAVLTPCIAGLGLDRDTALRVAAAFGGGLARRGELCGALVGAMMLAGLHRGATSGPDQAAKEATYALAQRILAAFQARHGTVTCRDLLGCDVGTPEGRQYLRDHDLHERRCARFVEDAIRLAHDEIARDPRTA